MNYDKKMVIITGDNSVKGTATVETNGNVVTIDLNVFNLPNLNQGEYYFGIKKGYYAFSRALGGKGRISTRFSVPTLETDNIHIVIFNEENKPLAYGTLSREKLWSGNLMDGIRRKNSEKNSKANIKTFEADANFTYSGRQIESFFNDITPPFDYQDDQIAAVNYFSGATEAKSFPVLASMLDNEKPCEDIQPFKSDNFESLLNSPNCDSASEKFASNSTKQSGGLNNPNCDSKSEKFANNNTKQIADIKNKSKGSACLAKQTISSLTFGKKNEINSENRQEETGEYSTPTELYRRYVFGGRENVANNATNNSRNNARNNDTYNTINNSRNNATIASNTQAPRNSEQNYTRNSEQNYTRNSNTKEPKDRVNPKIMTLSEVTGGGRNHYKIPLVKTFSAERAAKANKTTITFYQQMQKYLDKLFETESRYPLLENLIPLSKFVKVEVDANRFYVVGIIGKPDYICYGIPGVYSENPPKELDGYCSWLPESETDPMGKGFWLMYQDATTGETS